MKVENLKNYGKDIISIQKDSKLPFKKKLLIIKPVISFFLALVKEMKPAGFIRFIKLYKQEKRKALQLDWTHIEEKGILKEDLDAVISKEVMAKILVDCIGFEKASKLRNRLSDKIACHVLGHVFATPEEYLECGNGDFLPPFKQYYLALASAMDKAGQEKSEVAEDTRDCFQLNITYCVYYEVANTLGYPELCYYSTCYGDEVFFPEFCAKAGFKFERTGTLATGNPVCDMRFVRKK
jgi:hypothetical protein